MTRLTYNPQVHLPGYGKCPICGAAADIFKQRDLPIYVGCCDVCGDVAIASDAVEKARQQGKNYLVSRWLKTHPEGKREPALLKMEDLDAIFTAAPAYTVLEKLDLALVQIATMTRRAGQPSRFDVGKDYPLIYAEDVAEARFYVNELEASGFVDTKESFAKLTSSGYKRLQELQKSGRQSALAFVAMWFNDALQSLYMEAIKPAIIEAGYQPIQLQEHEHVNNINDEIIAQLRRSRFVVADFTGQRGGVYFEAGFMLGHGRNVFWMCRKSEMSTLHFDTRAYNFIDYETTLDAKKRLLLRILAVEGQGPYPDKRS